MPEEHAGGKWSLRYESAPGRTGNLEVDLNFMFRVPVVAGHDLRFSSRRDMAGHGDVPVLDRHELAAGKLAALLARRQARDVFDSHRILRMDNLDPHLLRIGFVVYGAMNRKDWRTVSAEDVDIDASELTRQLIPTLRVNAAEVHAKSAEYGARLVRECREGLSAVLPFTESERAFLDHALGPRGDRLDHSDRRLISSTAHTGTSTARMEGPQCAAS